MSATACADACRTRSAASMSRQFSDKDQAALMAILEGKYETTYDKSFEDSAAQTGSNNCAGNYFLDVTES